MRSSIQVLLVATAGLLFSTPGARADGMDSDYGAPGPYEGQPGYLNGTEEEAQPYQSPPEGVCYDDDNQPYDCANDPDYASYSEMDDGYDQSAYQDFQEALSPYGNWVQSPQYGNVWSPSASVVGYDFQPYYSGGHWVLTDYGWTWTSDWNWGWAPFHYGRWVSVASHGWCWVPGRVWGPAWVHWRQGGGYVGWTPLPPRGIRVAPPVGVRVARWNFMAAGQMGAQRLMRVEPHLVAGIYARTSPGNVLRSIGASRVNIGPLPATLSLSHLTPSPLRGLTQAMPRAHVTMRPGLPLGSRSYMGAGRPSFQAPGYQRPGFQAPAPTYQRPGYQAPVFQAPAYRPGYQAPGFQRQGYPAPMYQQHQGYQAPGYQRQGYQAPVYQQHQGYQAPVYQRPSYQAPMQAPVYQRPAYQAPVYQRPSYQAPAQAPVYQRPSYQAPMQAPVYQRPSYQAPAQAPVYQRPSYQAPAFQRPSYQAPAFQRPSYQAPAYRAPSAPSQSFRSAPSYSAPHSAAPSHSVAPSHSGGGGGFHRR